MKCNFCNEENEGKLLGLDACLSCIYSCINGNAEYFINNIKNMKKEKKYKCSNCGKSCSVAYANKKTKGLECKKCTPYLND